MKTWINHFWERLRVSFWVIPGACVALSLFAAWASLEVDLNYGDGVQELFPRQVKTSSDSLMSLLSTVATSVLTLAGLSFSATLVALSLASNQFGPRLLRNFIRSRASQVTFGILVGNFVFCLVVMRSIHEEFVPHLSGLIAFVLSILSLGAFIFFVHTIIADLQADRVVADVYAELDSAIEEFFPDLHDETGSQGSVE